MKLPIFLSFISIFLFSCQTETTQKTKAETLALTWKLESNRISKNPQFRANFTIKNNGEKTLKNDWILYFSQTPRNINKSDSAAKVEVINGDWYRMIPNTDFELKAGESIEIPYEGSAWMIKETDAPAGLYFTFLDKDGKKKSVEAVQHYEISPFETEEQILRHHADYETMPTAERFFEEHAKLSLLEKSKLLPVIPSPGDYQVFNQFIQLDNTYKIAYYYDMEPEAIFLQNALKKYGLELEIVKADNTRTKVILLESGQLLSHSPKEEPEELEIINSNITNTKVTKSKLGKSSNNKSLEMSKESGYSLRIDDAYERESIDGEILEDGYIGIMAGKKEGIFYGIQSIIQIVSNHYNEQEKGKVIIPKMLIWDTPRFDYRGVHLDIARNFQDKKAIKKLIDAMAFYKLNKLHLHLTEDEGWRLEIEELPELTEYGAIRGHTLTEERHLQPSYGSGNDVNDKAGSGYLTRADFKEVLQYAAARYIEVIPEINVPGHARAAIKSMNHRYRKFMEKGDEAGAKEFLLHDPEDKSEYLSVQSYPDNVVCPCQGSTYHFYETVLADLVEQYQEAGLELKTLHTGGDEVPVGVWEKSPLCQELISKNPKILSGKKDEEQYPSPYDLSYYFRDRISNILAKHNLTMAGWEEIALRREESGRYNPNADFQDRDFLPYVWNNLWGNQDLGNRLANAGYPVILCNVTHLYFDLAYNNAPKEPGFYWGGFVDTKKVWEFMPMDVLNSTSEDAMGKPFSLEKDYADMDRLTEEGKKNILGIQGQLWSETIKTPDMLEYYYLPKMIGLAERAWAQQPDWAKNLDEEGMNEAWNVFANTLGQRDLQRLEVLFGGYNYRKGTVGKKDGETNVAFPRVKLEGY